MRKTYQHVDVSRIGTTLETSEFGGYELTGWDVTDGTVSISLKPYGWQAMGPYMELISEDDVTLLESTWTDPETGETGTGYHSGIMYRKHDYMTMASPLQMVSYYAADDDGPARAHELQFTALRSVSIGKSQTRRRRSRSQAAPEMKKRAHRDDGPASLLLRPVYFPSTFLMPLPAMTAPPPMASKPGPGRMSMGTPTSMMAPPMARLHGAADAGSWASSSRRALRR